MQFLIIKTQSAETYHRIHNGEPACRISTEGQTTAVWSHERADTWREPCKHSQCFGEDQHAHERAESA